ncbi:MAG TPA: SusC/RagA family TonB-linked outer membrane protein, partial [Cyclobacteriaceae bacterium]|nr:SusC/RagA family TonB-linked outer membrane protein [Cyclobacteriaceae bacterium]
MDRILRIVKKGSGMMLLGILLNTTFLFGQSKSVTGTIRDGNEVLPGVTIMEKGTNNGTVSDVSGKFSLMVSDNATLLISFVGMKSQEIAVGGQTNFDIKMEADVTQLQDVVVIGYGEQERRDLTTSVSSVGSKQLKDIPINSTGQALAGRLAGVQVVTAEGTPNAQVQIRVRGGGSITQDNTPLYVVDGVQVENALNVIAPQDIQSIDVLKDASATAIYGARGANGVVIITTKGGKAQKLTVDYSGFFGMRKLANKLDVMKPYDFVMYQYERSRGNTSAENTFRSTYGNYADIELYKGVPFVDWQDESFGRTALQQTHNLSLTGGTAKTSANLSLTGNKEEGVQLGSDFNRFVANLRVDHKLNKYVKLGTTIRYNYTVINGAGTSATGSSSTNRLRQSVKYRPFLFPGQTTETYDPNYAQETSANSLSLVNPVLLATQEYQKDIQNTVNFGGYVQVDPLPYLSLRSTIGYDIYNEQLRVFSDSITNNARQNGQGKPIASIDSTRRTILNNSNVATFSLHKLLESFAKKNKLDVMVGEETYSTTTKTAYNESHLFPLYTSAEQALNSLPSGGTPFLNSAKQPKTEISTTLLS